MSIRKLKRRGVRLQYRGEIFHTYDLGTREYAGTYFTWHPTREAAPGVALPDGGQRG